MFFSTFVGKNNIFVLTLMVDRKIYMFMFKEIKR